MVFLLLIQISCTLSQKPETLLQDATGTREHDTFGLEKIT